MKKAINYIKIPSLCLAGLIAGSALLSACNAPEETTTTVTKPERFVIIMPNVEMTKSAR